MIPAAARHRQEASSSSQRSQQLAVSDDSDASPERRRGSMRPQPAPARPARALLLLATSTMTLLPLLCVLPAVCLAGVSDPRYCYDEACSVPVSEGRTTLKYNSNSKDVLSFPANTPVTVYSKEEGGNRNELWGVKIGDQRGHVPALFIREYKVLKKRSDLKYPEPIVDTLASQPQNVTDQLETSTQSSDTLASSSAPTDQVYNETQEDTIGQVAEGETLDPHRVSPSYDIYDGTKIPLENEDEVPTLESYSTKILLDEESIAAKLGQDEELSIFNFSSDGLSEEQVVVPPVGETVILTATEDSKEVLLNESVEIQGNKDVESSYFSEVPTEDVEPKEEVQLNMYPSLLSSTLSALSGILSNGEESSEDSTEVDSSEKPTDEETTEETPVITKPEESSPEIKLDQETEQNDIEDVFKKVQEELAQEAESKTIDEDVESKTNEITKNEKVPDDLDTQIDEIINQINELSEVEDKSSDKSEEQKDADVADVNHQTDSVSILNETSDSVDADPQEIPIPHLEESLISSDENVGKYGDVPEQEETETATSILEDLQAESDSGTHQNPTQGSELNESSVEPVAEEDPAILEVPLEEQNYVEPTTVSYEPVSSETQESPSGTHQNPTQSSELNESSIEPIAEKEPATVEVPLEEKNYVEPTTVSYEPITSETQEFPSTETLPIEESENEMHVLPLEVPAVETTNAVDPVGLEESTKINDSVIDSNNNVVHGDIPNDTVSPFHNDSAVEHVESNPNTEEKSVQEQVLDVPKTMSFGEFLNNRNLLNAEEDKTGTEEIISDELVEVTESAIHINQVKDETIQTESLVESEKSVDDNVQVTPNHEVVEKVEIDEVKTTNNDAIADKLSSAHDIEEIVTVVPMDTCDKNSHCSNEFAGHQYRAEENAVTNERRMEENSETLLVVCITAVTTLLFSLGYYFIESRRRDAYLIGKINTLEKDLMITKKECTMLDENFKSTKSKLDSIEDESFGSNEMVLSLKSELVVAENTKVELEDQIATLEKELESTSEAGLELERMLREILSSHSEENNPLAKSIEDLQVRLNEQQMANESLTNALAAKTQENETLTGDLTLSLKQVEQLKVEVTKLAEDVKTQMDANHNLEQTLNSKVHKFEIQVKSLSEDKAHIRKQLKVKELEVKELSEIVEKFNSDSLNFEKLYEVSHIKAEAVHLAEECNELKMKLSEEEGARQLLEEHMKVINQEIASLSEQCKAAEKEKKDAETRLEVLTKFFEEKESQRQKEEALWLEKQGEVSTTVDRLHTMQAEILNYKQQIEMLKREIVDQEREYKNQISALENKAHEHWLSARQNERRLEEVKAECSQLRNRLTLVEKSINDVDSDAKLNRLQAANGETGAHSSSLYPGGETSTSPLLFSPGGGGGGVPPPPSYLFGMPPPPPPGYLPPPPELVGSRPPPLGGGRLSSPPPQSSSSATQSGANNASSSAASPPPLMPPFPMPPFPGDHLPPLPPLHILKHMPPPSAGGPLPPLSFPPQHPAHHLHHNHHGAPWPPDEDRVEAGPPSSFARTGAQQQQQQRHSRNHKGSLHSSGESLDKSHHSGKV